MPRLVVTPRAEADIEDIAAFIELNSPESAERFLLAVQRTFSEILAYPMLGHPEPAKPRSRPRVRHRAVVGFRSHLVFYLLPDSQVVQIIRVLHGAANLQFHLRLADTD